MAPGTSVASAIPAHSVLLRDSEEGTAPKIFAAPQRDAGAAIDGLDLQDRIGVRETDPAGPAQGIQRVEQRLVEKTLFLRCRQPPFEPVPVQPNMKAHARALGPRGWRYSVP